MDVDEVIEMLYAAEAPSRALDQAVAKALGWTVQDAGRDSNGKTQVVWIDSNGREGPRAPYYTTSLHAIYSLAYTISDRGGASWEEGMGSAKLGDNEHVQANTPELALCIAVLIEIEKKKKVDWQDDV